MRFNTRRTERHFEHRVFTGDGEIRSGRGHRSPCKDAKGRQARITAIARTSPNASGPRRRCGRAKTNSGTVREHRRDGHRVRGRTDDNGQIIERRLRDANLPFCVPWAFRHRQDSREDIQPDPPEGLVRVHLPAVQKAWTRVRCKCRRSDRPESGRHYITSVVWLDAQTYLGTIWDITERKQAEEALRLSEEKFALSFANNPAAIAMTRLEDGLFLEVNDTWVALNGYSREEAIGHSAREMHIWPTTEASSRFVQELQEKGSLRGWEQEFLKKSGEVFVAQLSAQVLTLRGEKVILSTFVDITERKRAEEALQTTLQRLTHL